MVSARIYGAERLEDALRPLLERAKNPAPAMELVGDLGVRACQRNIDRQASPEGDPYKPTRRGGTILRDHSTMYNGITSALDSATRVTIGAGAVTQAYNAYQHFGSEGYGEEVWEKGPKKGQPKGNPPRPFIGIADADADEMIEEIADFLDGSSSP